MRIGKPPILILPLVLILLVAFLCVAASAAESKSKKRLRPRLPRVGRINDYEKANISMPGCGNHSLRRTPFAVTDIFLSNADGLNAWMNLDGRDVPLELVKTTLMYRHNDVFAYHYYRAGATRITISFIQLTDYISQYPAKIVLRKGRATRAIKAFGAPQCD